MPESGETTFMSRPWTFGMHSVVHITFYGLQLEWVSLTICSPTLNITSATGPPYSTACQSGSPVVFDRVPCPVFPLLFNAVIDEAVRSLDGHGMGYALNGFMYKALAFADDLAIVASSKRGIQASCNRVFWCLELSAPILGKVLSPLQAMDETGAGSVTPIRSWLSGESRKRC